MQDRNHSRNHTLSVIGLVLISLAISTAMPVDSLMGAAGTGVRPLQRSLSFEERVAYQRAIEDVYWRHRIWPKENRQPKPELDQIMPLSTIRTKVGDYLRKSQALELYWQRPITGEQLQAEMERMARRTKQPEMLKELWKALGDDPYVIAECLARPVLVNRLIRNWYAHDERYHGELKRQAEAEISRYDTVQKMRKTPRRPQWRMSGTYREVTWAKGETVEARYASPNADSVTLNSEQWDEKMRELEQVFRANRKIAGDTRGQLSRSGDREVLVQALSRGKQVSEERFDLPLGELSQLQEEEDRFYVLVVLEKEEGRVKMAIVEWKKEPFDAWWKKVQNMIAMRDAGAVYRYWLPDLGSKSGSCEDDTWESTFAFIVSSRQEHTAIWTGGEMIVWGGWDHRSSSFNTGGRYDPVTDSWVATSTMNAPSARFGHTAVWTGSEMIIWGGGTNTGGRYDPATDSWVATSTTNAPSARFGHTAVWTDREMIVWSGQGGIDTGGRYDPATDTWKTVSTHNAPSGGRTSHTAVWTGREMIIWGGFYQHNTGGRYDPVTDSWKPTATRDAPLGRWNHTAVWTGREMIIWGGVNGSGGLDNGGRYDPAENSWVAISTINEPRLRSGHTAVWTGSEMIIWGGGRNTGGRYDPIKDTWVPTSTNNVPSPRAGHTAVWTGSEMIIWGSSDESTSGRYDPVTDSWSATSTINAPSRRNRHTAVWTGREMIVWGGRFGSSYLNTGGRYDPETDRWVETSTTDAPGRRETHTAVWTGREMIVWGGFGGALGYLNTGGRYDPETDRWVETSTTDAPGRRETHTAVWTGREMIVWGGGGFGVFATGGRYDPVTDSWVPTSTTNVPIGRVNHTAVWTGNEMIIWGGAILGGTLNTGGRYDPATDSWEPTNAIDAPRHRRFHTAIWTGSEMIIWGGDIGIGHSPVDTGARYDPVTDSWVATSTINVPSPRSSHTAVWTGSEMIVWGGSGGYDTGGRYCASAADR